MAADLDLRLLRTFAILARVGSFTRTAKLMNVTQPAVSHGMKRLEAQSGCSLLSKMGKTIQLTPEGRICGGKRLNADRCRHGCAIFFKDQVPLVNLARSRIAHSMQKDEAETTRYNGTVAMWYSGHHQIDPRDWNNIEEFGGHHHPSLGYYKSDDPEVLRKHLHWIRRAGADAIVYDCFGFGQWDLTDLPKDKVLAMLVKLLANQEGESRKLKLIIWLEKWNSNPTVEQYRYALNYVREHFAELDCYFYYQGKPLVVTYHNGNNEAIDEIEFENEFFNLRRIRPYISDVWAYVDAYPQRLKREWMPASPGFNSFLEEAYIEKYVHKIDPPDLEAIRKRCPKAEREDGLFFEKQLLRAREVNPNFIFLSGWNDWQYACQIEPAVEYGFKYVDLSARLLGREAETAPYRKED